MNFLYAEAVVTYCGPQIAVELMKFTLGLLLGKSSLSWTPLLSKISQIQSQQCILGVHTMAYTVSGQWHVQFQDSGIYSSRTRMAYTVLGQWHVVQF